MYIYICGYNIQYDYIHTCSSSARIVKSSTFHEQKSGQAEIFMYYADRGSCSVLCGLGPNIRFLSRNPETNSNHKCPCPASYSVVPGCYSVVPSRGHQFKPHSSGHRLTGEVLEGCEMAGGKSDFRPFGMSQTCRGRPPSVSQTHGRPAWIL